MRVFAECGSVCQEVGSVIDSHNPFKKYLYVNFTTIVLVVTAAIVSGVVVWLFLQGRRAALAERLRAREEENARLLADVTTLRAEGTRLAALHAQVATQLEAERTAHERLTNEFKALSAGALKDNNEAFLKLAQATLEKYQEGAKGDLAARQQAVATLVQPLKESLEKVDRKIAEFETSRLGDNKLLAERLKDLGAAQLLLHAEASKLSTALRSTTYAGSWGELQLRRVVEMADMLPYCDFSEQETSGALRADLVVRLPGGQRIVVDAKAPLEAYRAASEATDEPTRMARLAEHAQKVRGHIDALGAKNYWEQFQPAPEFVVLFLPGDHFLTAALHTDRTLMDRALARRVLLATPTTLIALLKAASYGWNQEAISKNADEISTLGRQLYDRVSTFAENLDKVGRGLDAAVRGYNSAVGSFESTLLPGARRFAELGAKGTKELAPPAAVETSAREVVKKN
jgi:DNA recombination protein RmuC